MLVSFAFFAQDDLQQYRANMPCGRLMVDSGAYTAASTGKVISREEYADFLTTWAGVIDHAVTLDVIGDPVATARNTRWLHNRGHRVLPVFTRGGTVAEFDAMVRDCGYVCVGGGVGMSKATYQRRLGALQQRAQELGGGIHALGVGNLNSLRVIRPYSADTSNISSLYVYGAVMAYDGRELRKIQVLDRDGLRKHAVHLRAQGVNLAPLVRTGRLPAGKHRDALTQQVGMALACADEDTVRHQVPVPHGTADTPGTHFYSSLTGAHLARPTAALDRLLHQGCTVPAWRHYGANHARQCRAGDRQAVAS